MAEEFVLLSISLQPLCFSHYDWLLSFCLSQALTATGHDVADNRGWRQMLIWLYHPTHMPLPQWMDTDREGYSQKLHTDPLICCIRYVWLEIVDASADMCTRTQVLFAVVGHEVWTGAIVYSATLTGAHSPLWYGSSLNTTAHKQPAWRQHMCALTRRLNKSVWCRGRRKGWEGRRAWSGCHGSLQPPRTEIEISFD